MYQVSRMTTLKMIYFAYFQSIMDYGIIFQGDSTESKRIYQLQKKIIRIMTGSKSRNFLQNPYFTQINHNYSVKHNRGLFRIKLHLYMYATYFGPIF
jgi:hypothetical protein